MYSRGVAFNFKFACVSPAHTKRFWLLLFISTNALPFPAAAAVNRNGPHQSNNSHGSIQQFNDVGSIFLEPHNQSAQSYCVITQKVEP